MYGIILYLINGHILYTVDADEQTEKNTMTRNNIKHVSKARKNKKKQYSTGHTNNSKRWHTLNQNIPIIVMDINIIKRQIQIKLQKPK